MNRYQIWVGLILLFLLVGCGDGQVTSNVLDIPAEENEVTSPVDASDQSEESISQKGRGGTLRLFFWQAPTILNPHLSQGTKDLLAARIAYEPLASFNKEGDLVPFLAAEIPSLENGGVAKDGLSVTWTLKEGIQWSDGEPFTANDVLFTYEYITNPDVTSTSAVNFSAVANVEIIDDTTVTVNFNEPTAAWFLPFVGQQGMIIPRHIFEDFNGSNAAEAPANLIGVGTGPYRVVDFRDEDILIIGTNAVSTNKIIYEANPFFRDPDKPFFTTVEVQGGGDLNLAVQAAKEGLVDFAWGLRVPDDVIGDMETVGNSFAYSTPTSFVERIMINFSDPSTETADGERSNLDNPHPFFSDIQVRQALVLAINREAINEPRGKGGHSTTNIVVEPPYFNSANTVDEFDPEKAIELLDEAGWIDSDGDGVREKDGIELRVLFQTSIEGLRQHSQEQVKRDLEAVGFDVELEQIDASIFFGPPENTTDTRRHFYADLEEFAFNNKSPDPTAYMAAWICDEISQKENDWALTNWSRYCNPAFDALFEQALTELDPEKRAELFITMNDILIEDAAVIPLSQVILHHGVALDLKGVDPTPWDVAIWNIADWYWEE